MCFAKGESVADDMHGRAGLSWLSRTGPKNEHEGGTHSASQVGVVGDP